MNISIQILSTSVETKPTTKGSYQMVEIAYKDQSNGGKVGAKKIVSFGPAKDVFDVLVLAKPTEFYDIEMVKGEKYWEWTKATKGSAGTATAVGGSTRASTATPATNARGFETPEERAARQVYIVRQSSLSTAVELLSVGAKTAPKSVDVINLAKEFEAYVFNTGSAKEVAAKDVDQVPKFDDLEDPLPF